MKGQNTLSRGYTTRVNKTHSSFLGLNERQKPILTQNDDQAFSTHRSHRKYKLSHSQVNKIQKQGLERWKQKKQNSRVLTNEEFCQTQKQKRQSQQQNLLVKKPNYQVKRQKIIRLKDNNVLHVQIISFSLNLQKKGQQNEQVQLPISFQVINQSNIEVICFQIHDKNSNTHFRSQFTYKTLSEQIKFTFKDVQQLFDYVVKATQVPQITEENQFKSMLINFEKQSMQLEILIYIQSSFSKEKNFSNIKQNVIKISLLPFAVIQIVQDHHLEKEQTKQLKRKIRELAMDLQISKQASYILKKQNDALKLKLHQKQQQVLKEKVQRQILVQNIETLQKKSKTSQIPKQFFFQFVPDPKAKNYDNFNLKNQIIKKIKNDLKWDQLSSQAPLPKAGRHYYGFNIKNFSPDFMFGIVTLKGKDTVNAFMGLQTICLYASKHSSYIYERGRHYKISSAIRKDDIIYVLIDRQKQMIEWIKKKTRLIEDDPIQQKDSDQSPENYDLTKSIAVLPQHTQIKQNSPKSSIRLRKGSQNLHLPSQASINKITVNNNYEQQLQYIHSTKIPQQMLNHELYAYVQIYNINEALKLNEKK